MAKRINRDAARKMANSPNPRHFTPAEIARYHYSSIDPHAPVKIPLANYFDRGSERELLIDEIYTRRPRHLAPSFSYDSLDTSDLKDDNNLTTKNRTDTTKNRTPTKKSIAGLFKRVKSFFKLRSRKDNSKSGTGFRKTRRNTMQEFQRCWQEGKPSLQGIRRIRKGPDCEDV
jgi:hypothetical protein